MIYFICQVDDFALACQDEKTAIDIYDILGSHLKLPTETKVPFKYMGPIDDFNGINIVQSQEHIELSCSKYIKRVLISHGWATGSKDE